MKATSPSNTLLLATHASIQVNLDRIELLKAAPDGLIVKLRYNVVMQSPKRMSTDFSVPNAISNTNAWSMKPEFATEPRKILVPDRIKLDQLIN
jgi:hypothetical protein